ncbi:hypothetical protein ACFYNZ_30830 [Streptomyces kebangsaanensis]|uniref:Uncharacterized protein n=1 Tax=Streptomyces kebangsaanensis TaxID=864058 RepID=A0ABW6L4A0_9ACTN
MTLVADFVLRRLRRRGAERVCDRPGDGVDGPLGGAHHRQGIAPVPPRITKERGERAAEAAVHGPEGLGSTARGTRRKSTGPVGHLPGRH